MNKLISLAIILTLLALTAACGGGNTGQPPPQAPPTAAAATAPTTPAPSGQTSANPTPSSGSGPANTPIPVPTRPQRIQGLGATPTTQASPASPATPEPTSTGPTANQTATPTGQAPRDADIPVDNLVPTNPQTNDQVLPQDIYALMDLSEFALDPSDPIPIAITKSNGRLIERPDDLDDVTSQRLLTAFEPAEDHPYLFLFPQLQRLLDDIPPNDRADSYTKYSVWDISRIGWFLHHPWFEAVRRNHQLSGSTDENNHFWFGNNSTRGTLAQAVANALEQAKNPAAELWPTYWGGDHAVTYSSTPGKLTGNLRTWDLETYLRNPHDRIDGRADINSEDGYNNFPQTRWEFVHPMLPIFKVTSYVHTKLPFITGYQELREDPEINRSLNSSQIVRPTIFAVSFVIAFQNRWTSFDDPDRFFFKYEEFFKNSYPKDKETHELFPNYWHPSDYMQHSIIGPVVVQVYESETYESNTFQPGIYSATPRVTRWEAPGHIVPIDTIEIDWKEAYIRTGVDRHIRDLEYKGDQASDEQIERWTKEREESFDTFYRQRMLNWIYRPKHTAHGAILMSVNFPLPGDILVHGGTGPGTDSWEVFQMDGKEW